MPLVLYQEKMKENKSSYKYSSNSGYGLRWDCSNCSVIIGRTGVWDSKKTLVSTPSLREDNDVFSSFLKSLFFLWDLDFFLWVRRLRLTPNFSHLFTYQEMEKWHAAHIYMTAFYLHKQSIHKSHQTSLIPYFMDYFSLTVNVKHLTKTPDGQAYAI